MTFVLKNAGATYQKAIQKCLKTQIGKNVEAYVDDVVVKTTEEDKLIADLTETLAGGSFSHFALIHALSTRGRSLCMIWAPRSI
jgi:hypothetical protein